VDLIGVGLAGARLGLAGVGREPADFLSSALAAPIAFLMAAFLAFAAEEGERLGRVGAFLTGVGKGVPAVLPTDLLGVFGVDLGGVGLDVLLLEVLVDLD